MCFPLGLYGYGLQGDLSKDTVVEGWVYVETLVLYSGLEAESWECWVCWMRTGEMVCEMVWRWWVGLVAGVEGWFVLGAVSVGYVGEMLVVRGQLVVRVRKCDGRSSVGWKVLLYAIVLTASPQWWGVLLAVMLCLLLG